MIAYIDTSSRFQSKGGCPKRIDDSHRCPNNALPGAPPQAAAARAQPGAGAASTTGSSSSTRQLEQQRRRRDRGDALLQAQTAGTDKKGRGPGTECGGTRRRAATPSTRPPRKKPRSALPRGTCPVARARESESSRRIWTRTRLPLHPSPCPSRGSSCRPRTRRRASRAGGPTARPRSCRPRRLHLKTSPLPSMRARRRRARAGGGRPIQLFCMSGRGEAGPRFA